MIEPELSPDEPLRLQALRDTHQLDTPLEERFERITRLLQLILGTPIAAISLIDSDRQWFKSIQGLDVSETSRAVSFCGHTILQNEVMIVSDARNDPRFAANPLVTHAPKIVFYAGCPIRARDGSKIASLCAIDHQPRTLTPEEEQALRDLAKIAESELIGAFQSAAQQELLAEVDAVRRQSQVDSLTRLWNRTSILELLHAEVSRARRENRGVGVIMVDIDHFKEINDSLGHPAGDEVLRQAARRMLGAVREVDALGRYGGEEFMVVLGRCEGLEAATHVAERIRERVATAQIVTKFGEVSTAVSLGVSFGEHVCPDDAQALIAAADAALYRAKHAGRNRVEATTFVSKDAEFKRAA